MMKLNASGKKNKNTIKNWNNNIIKSVQNNLNKLNEISDDQTVDKLLSLYSNGIQLIIHSDNTGWYRFNNFLMVNSILIIAWIMIFTSTISSKLLLLILLSIVGFIISIFWTAFCSRNWRYLNIYMKITKVYENKILSFGKKIIDGPLNAGHKLRFICLEKISKTKFLTILITFLFLITFSILFLISIFN